MQDMTIERLGHYRLLAQEPRLARYCLGENLFSHYKYVMPY